MKALLIIVVCTFMLAGECQIDSKSSGLAAVHANDSCPCRNTSTYSYVINSVKGSQFLTNSSEEVKEAIQVVIGELIEKKI